VQEATVQGVRRNLQDQLRRAVLGPYIVFGNELAAKLRAAEKSDLRGSLTTHANSKHA